MPGRSDNLRRCALAVLALWLGLWPAAVAQAATPDHPCTAAASAGATCPGCATGCSDTESACCGDAAPASPNCLCCSAVGLVLFGSAGLAVDPDRCLVAVLPHQNQVVRTRHHRPPVPPPMASLPHTV